MKSSYFGYCVQSSNVGIIERIMGIILSIINTFGGITKKRVEAEYRLKPILHRSGGEKVWHSRTPGSAMCWPNNTDQFEITHANVEINSGWTTAVFIPSSVPNFTDITDVFNMTISSNHNPTSLAITIAI